MTENRAIEHDVFANWLPEAARLRAYGFQEKCGALVYEAALPEPHLSINVVCDTASAQWRVRIFDTDMGEEYTNHRLEAAAGFNASLRQHCTDVLLDIRARCCENQYFASPQARRMHSYIKETCGSTPEFLWPRFPGYAAYRRADNKKWFAVILNVPRTKVDGAAAANAGEVEILNIKAGAYGVEALLARRGIYPAWHMSKKHWVSIIFDETLPDADIAALIAGSYASVAAKRVKKS